MKRSQIRPLKGNHYDVALLHKARGRSFPGLKQIMRVNRFLSKREKNIIGLCLIFFLIGLVLLSIQFANKYRVQSPVRGGVYTEALIGFPQSINPIFASTSDVDMDIVRLIFSGLMRYDDKHRLVPDLAVKYEVSEDDKVYTFELRKDVVWHDGQPFTARDVIFTFETIQNSLVSSPLQVSFHGVQVSALDDYTVRFILPESFSPFLSSLTVGIIPEHLWFDVPAEQMRLNNLNLQPIGTGPFKFEKLAKNDTGYIYSYKLVAFDDYYRQTPFLEKFIFQFFPEYEGDTGAINAFREKKVTGLSFVPHTLRDKVERKYSRLYVMELPQYTALFLNKDHNQILKDNNVRLALLHTVDKQKILNESLGGEGYVINGPILPSFPGYDPEVGKTTFSFEEANKLLDKEWGRVSAEEYRKNKRDQLILKWEEDQKKKLELINPATDEDVVDSDDKEKESYLSDTQREQAEKEIDEQLDRELQEAQLFYRQDEDGNILELTIATTQGEEYKKVAKIIAGLWQNIGIKTNLDFVEPRDFNRKILKERDYDILLYGEIVGNDPDPFPFWHSSQIDYPGLNLSRYVNRNVDTLIENARETIEEDKRVEFYKKFQEIILAEIPAIFLYMPTYTYATTDEVHGIDVVRISHPSDRFADITTWYMKTKGEWNF